MTDLTVPEVAARYHCSQRHVLDLIRAEKLAATKPGKRWLVTVEAADAYQESTTNAPTLVRRRRRRAS